MRRGSRWMGAAAGILLLAALPAAFCGWLHPQAPRIPMAQRTQIGVASALNLAGALWVDARPQAEFDGGHVPKAVALPAGAWDTQIDAFLDLWQPGAPIVVYCSSKDCDAAELVAQRLMRELGADTRVYILRGGWEAWLTQ